MFGMSGNDTNIGPDIKQCRNRFIHCFQTVSKQCRRCNFWIRQPITEFYTVFPRCTTMFVHRFQTVSKQCFAISGMVRKGFETVYKQCTYLFFHCFMLVFGSRKVTLSESDHGNSLMSGSDTFYGRCHFLTCDVPFGDI